MMIIDLSRGVILGYAVSEQKAQEMYAALRKKAIDAGTATDKTLPVPENVSFTVKPVERAAATAKVITLAPKTESQKKVSDAIKAAYTDVVKKVEKEGKISPQQRESLPVITVAPVKKEKAVTFVDLPSAKHGGGSVSSSAGTAVFTPVEEKEKQKKLSELLTENVEKVVLPETVVDQVRNGDSVVATIPDTVTTTTKTDVQQVDDQKKDFDFGKLALVGGLMALPFFLGR